MVLDEDARYRFGEIIGQFTLPCFPLLNDVDEITTHSDAIVLAQGRLFADLLPNVRISTLNEWLAGAGR